MKRTIYDEVVQYIKNLSSHNISDKENACHGLLELGQDAVPILIETCQTTTNEELKNKILEMIWQYRSTEVTKFLVKVLNGGPLKDQMYAINGLAALSSLMALQELRKARSTFCVQTIHQKLCKFIDEAIEHIEHENAEKDTNY